MGRPKKIAGLHRSREIDYSRQHLEQQAKKPVSKNQKSDQELIAEALARGQQVTQCPPGEAQGALKWYTGTHTGTPRQ